MITVPLAESFKVLGVDEPVGFGWIPPVPDTRDYTPESASVVELSAKIGLSPAELEEAEAPSSVDLRKWCSPIENQGALGSCTANAAIGIVEYYERRAYNRLIHGSRLFTYKTTRNLMGVVGDTGAWLRDTMGSLVLFGVPPEKYWPYTTRMDPGTAGKRTFDEEPGSFVYAMADNYEATTYWCHDPLGKNIARTKVLASVKKYVANGIPSMFGFYGFPSFNESSEPGAIPYPCPKEPAIWGHAIVAVGYDDKKEITNTQCGKKTTGALLIRNSWGKGWGDKGYGWMPYKYVLRGLASDFWSMWGMGWADTGAFGL
jgi:C1A family cysteine protease